MLGNNKGLQIFALCLFCIGITGFLGMGLSLTFITWGIAFLLFIWDHHTQKEEQKEIKREFISRFLPSHLCANALNPNLVYKIIEKNNDTIKIQVVWHNDKPKTEGGIYEVLLEETRPFNEELFINLT